MGFELIPSSAVLVKPDSLRPLFRSTALARAVASRILEHRREDLARLGEEGVLLVKRLWDSGNGPDAVERRGTAVGRLEAVDDGPGLLAFLTDILYAEQTGHIGKYGETSINDPDLCRSLWNDYISGFNLAADATMPLASGVVTFGSARTSGLWNVEYGHPYLTFSEDDVFERHLSKKGQAMAGCLGIQLEVTEWSEQSY
jgi:hypothetical protein